jgi:hypothetical protein
VKAERTDFGRFCILIGSNASSLKVWSLYEPALSIVCDHLSHEDGELLRQIVIVLSDCSFVGSQKKNGTI